MSSLARRATNGRNCTLGGCLSFANNTGSSRLMLAQQSTAEHTFPSSLSAWHVERDDSSRYMHTRIAVGAPGEEGERDGEKRSLGSNKMRPIRSVLFARCRFVVKSVHTMNRPIEFVFKLTDARLLPPLYTLSVCRNNTSETFLSILHECTAEEVLDASGMLCE